MISKTLIAFLALVMFAGFAIAQTPSTQPAKVYGDVDVEKYAEMMKQPDVVILDVRTPEEYAAGHLPGSILIDFNSPTFAADVAKLDKSKIYLIYCRSGNRSVRACNAMGDMKFAKLFNMLGGINAWQSAGKPVQK
jgi:rhodanese-related sulfurtransferase